MGYITTEHEHQQYIFGEFALRQGKTLLHCDQIIHVPPKEIAVLYILLEAAGEIVSKDSLLERVWGNLDVTEESLTRCIYMLRCILQESKHRRYIQTVYGQGYRFICPVMTTSPSPSQVIQQCSVAVYPFNSNLSQEVHDFHHTIVKILSKISPLSLVVLPASITQNCYDMTDIVMMTEQLTPDYYLLGQITSCNDSWKVRMELVRANGHQLVNHSDVELCRETFYADLQKQLGLLLTQCIPARYNALKQASYPDVPDSSMFYLNARHKLQRYTPGSLQQALIILQQCIISFPNNPLFYSSLAECYLTMAQLCQFNQVRAITLAHRAANKAIELDPYNPQAIGLLALLNSLNSQCIVAKTLFKQAMLISPNSADLHYYYAWYLFLSGNLTHAQQSLDECLTHDPTRIAASALKLWISYYTIPLEETITLIRHQHLQYEQHNPVLQSIRAFLLALHGSRNEADALIHAVRTSGEATGLVAINLCYAEYCQNGRSSLPRLRTFLANANDQYSRPSLLPLILAVHGQEVALQVWQKLKQNRDIGVKVWCHDPRFNLQEQEVNGV